MTILVALLLNACDPGQTYPSPEPEPVSEGPPNDEDEASRPGQLAAQDSEPEGGPAANVPFNGERMPLSEGLTYTSGGDCDCGDTDTEGDESTGCASSTGDDADFGG